jgi:tetratricopeptide (TPR) repeat protein
LLLGEVALGMGRHAAAEEFLSMSSFILSRLPEADPVVRSRLYRNFGKLYLSQGNTAAAAEAFGKDVLAASQGPRGGPESLNASVGLWNLGKTLSVAGNADASLACFDRTVQIWHNRLVGRTSPLARAVAGLNPSSSAASAAAAAAAEGGGGAGAASSSSSSSSSPSRPPSPTRPLDAPPETTPFEPAIPLTPVEGAEGLEVLAHIRSVRANKLGEGHVAVAEARLTAAMVHVAAEDGDAAKGLELLEGAERVLREQLVSV